MIREQNLSPWVSYPVTIRFADVDGYGIVHHSAYFHYFEIARLAYSREYLGLADGNVLSVKFPLLACAAAFRRAIEFRAEPITASVAIECVAEAKLVFHYKLTDEKSGTLFARGSTTHVLLDENGRAMVQLPDQFLARIEELQNVKS